MIFIVRLGPNPNLKFYGKWFGPKQNTKFALRHHHHHHKHFDQFQDSHEVQYSKLSFLILKSNFKPSTEQTCFNKCCYSIHCNAVLLIVDCRFKSLQAESNIFTSGASPPLIGKTWPCQKPPFIFLCCPHPNEE